MDGSTSGDSVAKRDELNVAVGYHCPKPASRSGRAIGIIDTRLILDSSAEQAQDRFVDPTVIGALSGIFVPLSGPASFLSLNMKAVEELRREG